MSWSFNNPFHPVYSLSLIMIILCLAIYVGRLYLSKIQRSKAFKPHRNRNSKYQAFTVLKNRQRPMFLALMLSILFAILSLNWTIPVVEKEVAIIEVYDNDILQIEDVPIIFEKKQAIPKPKQPTQISYVEHPNPISKPEQPEPEPEPISIGKNAVIKRANSVSKKPSEFPILKPKRKEAEKVFIIVEEEPLFGDCQLNDKAKRKACTTNALFAYLKQNLEYPAIAAESAIQGSVIVQFIVEKDGSVTETKILRGIGGGCDEEALKVIESMPKWTPGKQRGRPVRVQFTLPVRFILQ